MKQVLGLILLMGLWISPFPSATASATPDFTQLRSEEELRHIRFFVLSVQTDPKHSAEHLVNQFIASPAYGWEADWLSVLKALDLIGYYWSVEKAQNYASADRWTPPPHPFQDQHLEFYRTTINPEAQLYSSGVLNAPFTEFARTLLKGLLKRKDKAGGDVRVAALISYLLETKHEFWQKMVTDTVLSSPLATTDFVSLLLTKFDSPCSGVLVEIETEFKTK